jgi:hypothetical protein
MMGRQEALHLLRNMTIFQHLEIPDTVFSLLKGSIKTHFDSRQDVQLTFKLKS